MIKIGLGFAVAALAAVAIAPAASAGSLHHHIHRHGARQVFYPPQGYAAPAYGYAYGSNWEGDAVARATLRAQREPGVTTELAPDAKETATGGPVGGVPGFDGS